MAGISETYTDSQSASPHRCATSTVHGAVASELQASSHLSAALPAAPPAPSGRASLALDERRGRISREASRTSQFQSSWCRATISQMPAGKPPLRLRNKAGTSRMAAARLTQSPQPKASLMTSSKAPHASGVDPHSRRGAQARRAEKLAMRGSCQGERTSRVRGTASRVVRKAVGTPAGRAPRGAVLEQLLRAAPSNRQQLRINSGVPIDGSCRPGEGGPTTAQEAWPAGTTLCMATKSEPSVLSPLQPPPVDEKGTMARSTISLNKLHHCSDLTLCPDGPTSARAAADEAAVSSTRQPQRGAWRWKAAVQRLCKSSTAKMRTFSRRWVMCRRNVCMNFGSLSTTNRRWGSRNARKIAARNCIRSTRFRSEKREVEAVAEAVAFGCTTSASLESHQKHNSRTPSKWPTASSASHSSSMASDASGTSWLARTPATSRSAATGDLL
mmetsp:Transcript_129597/g.415556  ORF Transcript_129597/g.415556 Transcript_129597/m.415556 type:complete len:444 (-) Transcript_129597:3167-4498(-)